MTDREKRIWNIAYATHIAHRTYAPGPNEPAPKSEDSEPYNVRVARDAVAVADRAVELLRIVRPDMGES